MEAVSRRFRIADTTFHSTSTRPIKKYSPITLGISTTTRHVKSSNRRPYPKSTLTPFSQCVIVIFDVYLFSSISSPPGPPITETITYATAAFADSASSFRAYANHPFGFYALTPEGPLEQWFCSRFTTH